jgi:hypothetical protein
MSAMFETRNDDAVIGCLEINIQDKLHDKRRLISYEIEIKEDESNSREFTYND